MSENANEVKKEETTTEAKAEQQVAIPTLPEKEMDPQRKAMLLQELDAIGSLIGATWNKPIIAGDYRGQNRELKRTIPVNIFSDRMILIMQKRAEFIMQELGWF